MHIADAQREVRTLFLDGTVGCAVAGALWLVSAALSTGVSPRAGILMLVIGGAFIFPVVQLSLEGAIAQLAGNSVSAGAWLTGAVLVVAAFAFWYFPPRERQGGTHGG